MNNISKLVIIGSVAITLSSCGDSWLEPKPLSFYSPENTLVDAKGMWAALGTCEKRIKAEFYGDVRGEKRNVSICGRLEND